jgi:hypothetical protein
MRPLQKGIIHSKEIQTVENFGVIEIFKSSQPKGCSGIKISPALKFPHILNFAKVSLPNTHLQK